MQLVYDQQAWQRLKEEYPFGNVQPSGHALKAEYREVDGRFEYKCMVCGEWMINRSDMKLVKGQWLPRKTKGYSQHECKTHGLQPIGAGISPRINISNRNSSSGL